MNEDQILLLQCLAWVVINALVGFVIGRSRARPRDGVLLAVVLGPLGWMLIFALHDLRRRCPECQGVIPNLAKKCMHCGSETPPMVPVMCPACGEQGQVPDHELASPHECPSCRRRLHLARRDLAPIRIPQDRAVR